MEYIETTSLFGSEVTIIGTTHKYTKDYEDRITNKLNQISPGLVLLEYPENGHPSKNLEDSEASDIRGCLNYCNSNPRVEYKCIDKYTGNFDKTFKEEIKEDVKDNLKEANTGDEYRDVIFNQTNNFAKVNNEREQNMVRNIINYAGDYTQICVVVGSTHFSPIYNSIETFNY